MGGGFYGSLAMGCTNLTSVSMPLYAGTFGGTMFQDCTALTGVTHSGVTSVGASAFLNCTSLLSFDCSNLIGVGSNAFQNCSSLTDITNLDSCLTINTKAFHSCTLLESFTAPLVTDIAVTAFYLCESVTAYNFPELTGVTTSTGGGTSGTFQKNYALLSFVANKLDTISGGGCFNGNTNMTGFTAPLLTGTVGSNTFNSNSSLVNVDIGSATTISTSAFVNASGLVSIDLSNVVTIGTTSFIGCSSLTDVINLNSCTSIGFGAFYSLTLLESMDTPLVTWVGEEAFYNCQAITSWSFPELLTFDSGTGGGTSGTFQKQTALTGFTAPSLTGITGGGAFGNNSAITDIYMPLLTNCGGSSGSTNTFNLIQTGCTITVGCELKTNNGGGRDGDIAYAEDTRSAIINYTCIDFVEELIPQAETGNFTSLLKVTPTRFFATWSTNAGRLASYDVDTDGQNITEIDKWTTGSVRYNSRLLLLDSTHVAWVYTEGANNVGRVAISYAGSGNTGYVCTVSWNPSTYAMTVEHSALEYESTQWVNPDICRINDDTFAVATRGTSNDGYLYCFSVSAGTYQITNETNLEFDPVDCNYPSLVKIDDTHYGIMYAGGSSNFGRLMTLSFLLSTHTFTEIDDLQYSSANPAWVDSKLLTSNQIIGVSTNYGLGIFDLDGSYNVTETSNLDGQGNGAYAQLEVLDTDLVILAYKAGGTAYPTLRSYTIG